MFDSLENKEFTTSFNPVEFPPELTISLRLHHIACSKQFMAIIDEEYYLFIWEPKNDPYQLKNETVD